MQGLQNRFVAVAHQDRPVHEQSGPDSPLPGYYLVVPGVTRRSSQKRVRGRSNPQPVLLGPFRSEVEARFIRTSALALGLLVERAEPPPVRSVGWIRSAQAFVPHFSHQSVFSMTAA